MSVQFPVIIISGPTCSGKTQTSIDLAKYLIEKEDKKAAIINFDSLLFYRELSLGTAKPTLEERQGVPHYLIDVQSAKEPLNAHEFSARAEIIIKGLHKKNVIPILIGGSGFYLRALIKGMYDSNTPIPEIKTRVANLYQEKGIEGIISELEKVDPKSLEQLHPNDHYRLMRALEHFLMSGTPLSSQKEKLDDLAPYDFSTCQFPEWKIHHIYLDMPKDEHWPYMEKRAAKMVENGLIQEVESLLKNGLNGSEKPLQSIGYKETIDFINQAIPSEKKLIERIYINTRRLAKSQRTFFNKVQPKTVYHPLAEREKILQDTLEFLKEENEGPPDPQNSLV